MAAFADKDYLSRPPGRRAWLLNLIYPVFIVAPSSPCAGVGDAPNEAGLVAGCLALIGIFLATLPFVAPQRAVVPLQISRVFWMADLLAIVVMCGRSRKDGRRRTPRAARGRRRAPALGARRGGLASAAALRADRGASRAAARRLLPADDWRDVSTWLRPRRRTRRCWPIQATRSNTALAARVRRT